MDLAGLLENGAAQARVVSGMATDYISAAELADSAERLFGRNSDTSTVAAVLTNDPSSIALVLAAIRSGVRLVSLPVPARSQSLNEYSQFIAEAVIAYGDVREVLVRDDLVPLLGGIQLPVLAHSEMYRVSSGRSVATPAPDGFELIQFSSGATGPAHGICITADALAMNISSIMHRIQPQPGDVAVSWLPLSHDMGLIGMLLTAIAAMSPSGANGGDVVILEPADFLRNSRSWIDALDHWGGTFTASPAFGYSLAARRPLNVTLDRLRCAIVGGDIVQANALDTFSDAFESCGFDARAFCPAYGLAEVGLAATLTAPGDRWRKMNVDYIELGERRIRAPGGTDSGFALVSSGPPLKDYRVAGGDDGQLGHIAVSLFARDSNSQVTSTGLNPSNRRIVQTTDLGFTDDDGWLYVVGRDDDYISVRGRNLYAPAIEAAVGNVPGVRAGRVTAVGLPTGEWLIALERQLRTTGGGTSHLGSAVQRAVIGACDSRPDHVVVLGPGRLPLTSSGKLQRRSVQSRWISGELV